MLTRKKKTKWLLRPSGTYTKDGVCGGNKRHSLMRHREIYGDLEPTYCVKTRSAVALEFAGYR